MNEFFGGLKFHIADLIKSTGTCNPFLITFKSLDLSKFIVNSFFGGIGGGEVFDPIHVVPSEYQDVIE